MANIFKELNKTVTSTLAATNNVTLDVLGTVEDSVSMARKEIKAMAAEQDVKLAARAVVTQKALPIMVKLEYQAEAITELMELGYSQEDAEAVFAED